MVISGTCPRQVPDITIYRATGTRYYRRSDRGHADTAIEATGTRYYHRDHRYVPDITIEAKGARYYHMYRRQAPNKWNEIYV